MEKRIKSSVNKLSCRERRIKRSVNKSVSEGEGGGKPGGDINLRSILSLLNVNPINDGRRKAEHVRCYSGRRDLIRESVRLAVGRKE